MLHTSHVPDQAAAAPLGRDEQAAALRAALRTCLGNCSGASLYISGLPGTGACVENPCRTGAAQGSGEVCVSICLLGRLLAMQHAQLLQELSFCRSGAWQATCGC